MCLRLSELSDADLGGDSASLYLRSSAELASYEVTSAHIERFTASDDGSAAAPEGTRPRDKRLRQRKPPGSRVHSASASASSSSAAAKPERTQIKRRSTLLAAHVQPTASSVAAALGLTSTSSAASSSATPSPVRLSPLPLLSGNASSPSILNPHLSPPYSARSAALASAAACDLPDPELHADAALSDDDIKALLESTSEDTHSAASAPPLSDVERQVLSRG